MDRKDFLKNITLGSLGVVVAGSVLSACKKDDQPDKVEFTIDTNDDDYKALKNDGGFVVKERIYIINNGGEIIAISQICTHQECPVSYIPSAKSFPCQCHGSIFDINGNVLNGPAQQPLFKYDVVVDGTRITVSN